MTKTIEETKPKYSTVKGEQNEWDFIIYFNNKKIKDLDPRAKDFIKDIYGNLDPESIIKAWSNHCTEKVDIFIKIDGIKNGLSIKKGYKAAVHTEGVTPFTNFLKTCGVSKVGIWNLLDYHYADGTLNGKGEERLSISEYKDRYPSKIKRLNEELNKEEVIKKVVERVIINGTKGDPIDVLVYGIPGDFVWIKKEDIVDVILSHKDEDASSAHFGPLTYQPFKRNLERNPNEEINRFHSQIKWYQMNNHITEYLIKNKKLSNIIY